MVRLKKGSIITTAILIGILIIGGMVYAVVQNNQYQEALKNATNQIKIEQDTLDALYERLEGYELDNGYLSEELTADVLAEVENSLNSVKDSYIDFHIEKDDLKDEIKVIKLDKKELEQKLAVLNSKLELQDKVNNLFEGAVLVGSKATEQPITDKVTKKEVEQIKTEDLTKVEEASKWKDSLESTLKDATSQLDQIELANKKVDAVHKDDKVVKGVSRDAYTEAKTEVDKVKNESIKKGLATRLTSVLKVVEADELKARQETEEKARQEAEAQAQAESAAQTQSSQGNTSSNSTGTVSTPKSSSGQASTEGSKSTNQSSSSKSEGSKSSGASQPSKSTKPTGGSDVTESKWIGSGKITNEDGSDTGRTYDVYEFEVPADWYN